GHDIVDATIFYTIPDNNGRSTRTKALASLRSKPRAAPLLTPDLWHLSTKPDIFLRPESSR
ncbi:MAG: hypothetical protein RBT81_10750, partial [Gammaproteobacteria bacterium]|nr:hypothetical protein [Gammaproteobacteria bacterium]